MFDSEKHHQHNQHLVKSQVTKIIEQQMGKNKILTAAQQMKIV